jgi:hypothetical protein
MSWRGLLQEADEKLTVPWLGGRLLRSGPREWEIKGDLPPTAGWGWFRLQGRTARWGGIAEPRPETLTHVIKGFLVGDRLVRLEQAIDPDPGKIVSASETVHLLDEGLGRFVFIAAGRFAEDCPLVFKGQEFPLGPEDAVQAAYEDRKASVTDIPGVPPALDAAFRMESWFRAETEKRRAEAERQRLEAERKLQEQIAREAAEQELAARREQIRAQLGDSESRRQMALIDFAEAASAALRVGGAEYLDHRRSGHGQEMVVRFRITGARLGTRRFECTCNARTLQIIDAGICLTAHYDDPNFEGGTEGDGWFTLESLPSVIREADRLGKLVQDRGRHL